VVSTCAIYCLREELLFKVYNNNPFLCFLLSVHHGTKAYNFTRFKLDKFFLDKVVELSPLAYSYIKIELAKVRYFRGLVLLQLHLFNESKKDLQKAMELGFHQIYIFNAMYQVESCVLGIEMSQRLTFADMSFQVENLSVALV
jgi:hypothetical protein